MSRASLTRLFLSSLITLSLIYLLSSSLGAEGPLLTGVYQPASSSIAFADVSEPAGIRATHQGSWNEYSQTQPFTEGYMGIGQAWGDYDNDGWVDLYVTGNQADNVLYHNNGDGSFAVSPLSAAVSLPNSLSGGAVWADYDNDGWRDLYVLRHGPNVLFHNDRGRGFSDVSRAAGVADPGKGSTATWGDYDEDGFLDLYVVNWSCYPECDPIDLNRASDAFYHNNGDGTFSDVSNQLQRYKLQGAGFSASFVDYDNDGDSDLYVVNDKLQNPIGNLLWRNDGPGCDQGWCWTDVSAETGSNIVLNGMGLAVGDYDNDLDLDLYFSNMVNPMALLQNQAGLFADVALPARVGVGPSNAVGWGTAFFDCDNDGWLDLFLATTEFRLYEGGMHFSYPNYLFQNNGDGTFTSVGSASWTEPAQPSMGFAYADYDQDGRVDFVLGNWNEGYALYHNESATALANGWLTIRLTGGGPVNRDAIGSRVYVTTSDGRVQMRELNSGASLGAGNDTALYFGLGQAAVEQVRVVWPDGLEQQFDDVPANQVWTLTYPDAAGVGVSLVWVIVGGLSLLALLGLFMAEQVRRLHFRLG